MGRFDPAGVQRPRVRSLDLPLQIPPPRAGRRRSPHRGDLPDPRPVRLHLGRQAARTCASASRELGDQHEENQPIYNELGLQLRNKTPKRRVKAKLRDDRHAASTLNDVWAMDFVHDQLATGQKIRVLTVVDTFSRFSPVLDPRFSYRAKTSWPPWNGSARRRAIRRRSELTRARSSSAGISISGPMPRASLWTSHGPANRRTTPSLRPSTGVSGRSA